MSNSFRGWTEKAITKLNIEKQPKKTVKKTDHREKAIALILKINNINFEPQYKFHPTRKFRFDFAILEHKIAIEYEGGTWSKSRHTSGAGYARDVEKYRLALLLGWKVLRYTVDDIEKGRGLQGVVDDINELKNMRP